MTVVRLISKNDLIVKITSFLFSNIINNIIKILQIVILITNAAIIVRTPSFNAYITSSVICNDRENL